MIKAVIFDFGYTIYDPDKNELLKEAVPLLENLKNRYKLALTSRTTNVDERLEQIKKLGLNEYFDTVAVTAKGQDKDLSQIMKNFRLNPEEVLVVGDRIDSEIRQGNTLGMKTAHFRYGPRQKIEPQNDFDKANFEINNLEEILILIQ